MADPKAAVDPAGRAALLLGWFAVAARGIRTVRDEHVSGRHPLDPELLRGVASIDPWFRAQLAETEELAYFSLVTVAEALIMTDYARRVSERAKDGVSRRFRELAKQAGTANRHVSLERDILEVWREEVPTSRAGVSTLRSALKYRHWIAHGKYFQPKLGATVFDPEDLFDDLKPLFAAIGVGGWS